MLFTIPLGFFCMYKTYHSTPVVSTPSDCTANLVETALATEFRVTKYCMRSLQAYGQDRRWYAYSGYMLISRTPPAKKKSASGRTPTPPHVRRFICLSLRHVASTSVQPCVCLRRVAWTHLRHASLPLWPASGCLFSVTSRPDSSIWAPIYLVFIHIESSRKHGFQHCFQAY